MGKLHNAITKAVSTKKLMQPFSVNDVNNRCSNLLLNSPSFLSKHAEGNPGGYTEYFVRMSKGKYKLL